MSYVLIVTRGPGGVGAGFVGAVRHCDPFEQYNLLLSACDNECLNWNVSGRIGLFLSLSVLISSTVFLLYIGRRICCSYACNPNSRDHVDDGTIAHSRPVVAHLDLGGLNLIDLRTGSGVITVAKSYVFVTTTVSYCTCLCYFFF